MPPVALITGCSSGIGFDLVRPMLLAGYRVVATMRNAEERRLRFSALEAQFPGSLQILDLDVTDRERRAQVVAHLQREHGGLDVLVNNAGYGVFGALEHLSEDEIRRQLEVNTISVILLIQECLPLLRSSRGRIINLSSVLGAMSLPLASLYCTSKFALEGLAEALFYELAPYGVQICSIEPGRHRTDFSKNLIWGSRRIADPVPYTDETKRYREDMRSGIEDQGGSAENVVRTILAVLKRRKMPLRVACGLDSRGASLLKKLLPAPLFHAVASVAIRYAYYRQTARTR